MMCAKHWLWIPRNLGTWIFLYSNSACGIPVEGCMCKRAIKTFFPWIFAICYHRVVHRVERISELTLAETVCALQTSVACCIGLAGPAQNRLIVMSPLCQCLSGTWSPVLRGTVAAKGCQTGRLHQSKAAVLKPCLIMSWAVGVALQPLSCFQTRRAKSSWIKGLFDHPAMCLGGEIKCTAPWCLLLSAELGSWKPTVWPFLSGLDCEHLSWWRPERNNGKYPGTICLQKHWPRGQQEAVKTCRTFFFSLEFFLVPIFSPPQWQDVSKSCHFNQLFMIIYLRILVKLSTERSVKFHIKADWILKTFKYHFWLNICVF